MRTLRKCLVATVFFFQVGGLHAQGEARAIVEKAVRAHGGETKLAKFGTMRIKVEGRIVAKGQNTPITLEEVWRLPHQYRLETVIGYSSDAPSTSICVVDKDAGWCVDHRNRARSLDKDMAQQVRDSGYTGGLLQLYLLLRDERYEISSLGGAKIDGKDAFGVLVKVKGRRDHTLYFDKHTGLLLSEAHQVKAALGRKDVLQQIFFRDYQNKDGVKQPRQVVIYQDGDKILKGGVTKIDFPEKLDDKLVERP